MIQKKLVIRASRIIAFNVFSIILIVNLLAYTLYYYNSRMDDGGIIYLPLIIISTILLLISLLAIAFLYLISFNEYEYEGMKIAIYSGPIKHYLYIDGYIIDSYKGYSLSKNIYLRAKYHNHRVEAIIPVIASVRLIIDNKYINKII